MRVHILHNCQTAHTCRLCIKTQNNARVLTLRQLPKGIYVQALHKMPEHTYMHDLQKTTEIPCRSFLIGYLRFVFIVVLIYW